MVLTKVDPGNISMHCNCLNLMFLNLSQFLGFSDLRAFVQKELNFCRLQLWELELSQGQMTREDYLMRSRQSLDILNELDQQRAKLSHMFK